MTKQHQRLHRRTSIPSYSGPLHYDRRARERVREALRPAGIHPKLHVGATDDPAEREADRIADAVANGGRPSQIRETAVEVPRTSGTESDGFEAATETERRLTAIRGGGMPLPETERGFFESRMGADLSGVRVHHGREAAELAAGLGARAFAHGRDLVFGAGEYRPSTPAGRHLIAHELAHVVQQGGGRSQPLRRDPPEAAPAPINPRFAGNPTLTRLYRDGGFSLNSGHNGDAIQQVQEALIDLSYALPRFGADGKYGDEFRWAIWQFQSDTPGLTEDGDCGKDTLHALSAAAPQTPGTRPQRYFDYGRLLADGRLDVTVAFGYDEHGINFKPGDPSDEESEFIAWLSANSFSEHMPATNPRIFSKTIDFQVDNGGAVASQSIEVVIRVITPASGAEAAYQTALKEDEFVTYTGHARYGSGPDFDEKDDPDEHFVIGVNSPGHRRGVYDRAYNQHIREVLKDEPNDLEAISDAGGFDADRYQVWAFNACSTVNYWDELRGGIVDDTRYRLVADKDHSNLDLIGTHHSTPLAANGDVTIALIEGLLQQKAIDQIIEDMHQATLRVIATFSQAGQDKYLPLLTGHRTQFQFHEGFGGNPGNPYGR